MRVQSELYRGGVKQFPKQALITPQQKTERNHKPGLTRLLQRAFYPKPFLGQVAFGTKAPSYETLISFTEIYNLNLTPSARKVLTDQHPLMQGVAGSTNVKRCEAARNLLHAAYGRYYRSLGQSLTDPTTTQTGGESAGQASKPVNPKPSRDQLNFTNGFLNTGLPILLVEDTNFSSLNVLQTAFNKLNSSKTDSPDGSPEDHQALETLIHSELFWKNAAIVYGFAHQNTFDDSVPPKITTFDGGAAAILKHWIDNPQQTLYRLKHTNDYLSHLSEGSTFYGRTKDPGFNKLLVALSAPGDNKAFCDIMGHYSRTLPNGNTGQSMRDLSHHATAHLVAGNQGRNLIDNPVWSGRFYRNALAPDKESAKVFDRFDGVPDTQVAASLPMAYVHLYAHTDRNPRNHPEDQRAIVNLTPFMHDMDWELLQPYVQHVDQQGMNQNSWGVETELMYLLGHDKLMVEKDNDAIQWAVYAVTAPAYFAGNQVPRIKEPMWYAWYDMARMAHSFRTMKFDGAGGPKSVLAQFPEMKGLGTQARPNFKKYGPGFYCMTPKKIHVPGVTTKPKHPLGLDDPKAIVEFRRAYWLISVPNAGTLVVPNKSINPKFNKRSELPAPAYYSERFIDLDEIYRLDPGTDPRFKSVLTPNLYKHQPGTNGKLIYLTNQLKTAHQTYNRWKADFLYPEWEDKKGPQLTQRGGFKAITDRLKIEIAQNKTREFKDQKHFSLALYNPNKAPFAEYPFETNDSGLERRLPITPEVLQEMEWATQGAFLPADERGHVTDFVNFLLKGIEQQAILVVEDGPMH